MATQSAPISIPVGPNIVRAWIDTVISPLLDGLSEEESRLQERRWGWEPRPPLLRSAHRTKEYLDVRAWRNLGQILDFVPELEPILSEHDEQAQLMLSQFISLQRVMENSQELSDIYQTVAQSLQSDPDASTARSLDPANRSVDLIYLAAYVINGHDQLYSYYTLAPIWNRFSTEFLAIRNYAEFHPAIAEIEKMRDSMLDVVRKLARKLEELWRRLSIQHDVPFFPSQTPSSELP